MVKLLIPNPWPFVHWLWGRTILRYLSARVSNMNCCLSLSLTHTHTHTPLNLSGLTQLSFISCSYHGLLPAGQRLMKLLLQLSSSRRLRHPGSLPLICSLWSPQLLLGGGRMRGLEDGQECFRGWACKSSLLLSPTSHWPQCGHFIPILTSKKAENCLPVFSGGGNGAEMILATEILTYILSSRYLPLSLPSLSGLKL